MKKDVKYDDVVGDTSSRDLRNLQARALEEGVPYQTFAASLLHKFVNGHLVNQ